MFGDILCSQNLVEEDATGIEWVEASDAAKHPVLDRRVPTTKDYLAPKVNVPRLRTPEYDMKSRT